MGKTTIATHSPVLRLWSDQAVTPADHTILCMGLSGSGKTTFITALDVLMDAEGDADRLKHADLADDRAYMQPLRQVWLKAEDVGHTSRTVPPSPHELRVIHRATGTRATVWLPDLAGETFDTQFLRRGFDPQFADRAIRSTGALLFVHSNHNADHDRIEHEYFLQQEDQPADSPPPSKWDLSKASRQTKLVDILQFVARHRLGAAPLRVAVLISAWDLVEAAMTSPTVSTPGPAAFLAAHWSMLDQYLASRPDSFTSRIYGVSARGGGHAPEDMARLQGMTNPADRVFVLDGHDRSNDITRPIRWLLDLLRYDR